MSTCTYIHVYTMQTNAPRLKFLIVWDDLAKKNVVFGQRSDGGQQPAIPEYSLLHIKPAPSTNKQFRITAYVLREPGGGRTTVTSGFKYTHMYVRRCMYTLFVYSTTHIYVYGWHRYDICKFYYSATCLVIAWVTALLVSTHSWLVHSPG